eukprot:TRINITY_DN11972_c7_g1_i1.p1 TRINITY_DN11972_c7_g1~~TRINITY_DN11972_c7_g1_i1.p1  ORF type:complete len:332 (-),score=69.50 TRINITY_DN11972_c7_g1_i1:21-1016(-)
MQAAGLRCTALKPLTSRGNAAISMAEQGVSSSLLSEMRHVRLHPDATIREDIAFGRHWQDAAHCVMAMLDRRVLPDQLLCDASIDACRRAAGWQSALSLMEAMATHRLSTTSRQLDWWRWLRSLERGEELVESRRRTDKQAEQDRIVYSACISACEKGGQWQHAIALLAEMAGFAVQRNSISYNATVSACEKAGQWERALVLVAEMKSGSVESCHITYNACIAACDQAGQWEHAMGLLAEMAFGRLQRCVITYNACVEACHKGSHWDLALGLLAEMQERKVHRNSVTRNAAISACEKSQQWLPVQAHFGKRFFEWYFTGRCSEAERWKTIH